MRTGLNGIDSATDLPWTSERKSSKNAQNDSPSVFSSSLKTLPCSHAGEALSKQLIRAGLGVAGNYRSAFRARSHAEFTARLAIVLEEADESELWLDVIGEKLLGTAALRARLLKESRELRAIFAKAVVTARSKERSR